MASPAAIAALLPALFLALLTFGGGTFAGGADFPAAATAHAALLGLCVLAGGTWRDPLALGRGGRWLVPAWVLAVGASWWAGPVHRAGVVALLLLPAVLLVPSAVANCWSGVRDRRRGVASLCLLLGLVALAALLQWRVQGSPRAAMPLGHHNLLAGWLIMIWPVGLLPLVWSGAWRAIGAVTALAGVAALAASSSFLGACAFLLQALAAGIWWKRARGWLALALLVVFFGPTLIAWPAEPDAAMPPAPPTQLDRAQAVAVGGDSSAIARTVYARAGWEGLQRRPLLGWGPGSVPWTAAAFLRPVAGLNPASEIVGDLHSLPIQAAYELGLTGIALGAAIVALFAWRRSRELRLACDRPLLLAAGIGLAGGSVFFLGNAPLSILALPAAGSVIAGAALAAGPDRSGRRLSASPLVALLYVLPAAVVLQPYERAHFYYQRATVTADPAAALSLVAKASEIDPEFPLYRARAAWLAAAVEGADDATAESARRAAEQAHSVAPLWLAAGALALDSGAPWAAQALEVARRLDPLSPMPAFHLLRARPEARDAAALGGFAVSAEPRLCAAVFWERHPDLWSELCEPIPSDPSTGESPARKVRLALAMDDRAAVSFSLFAFRRSPWPADLAPVELRPDRLGLKPRAGRPR